MAKACCKKHKRFVPTCDPCKSAALRETVGFPGGRTEAPPGPSYEAEPEASETVNDIPDYEPDEEELPPRPSEEPPNYPDPQPAPAGGGGVPIGGMFPPKDIDETEEAMAAEGEFDFEGAAIASLDAEPSEPILTPGEGEPEITPYSPEEDDEADKRVTQMSPLEMAMFMFPQRLMSQGLEPFIERTLASYLELGLMPEDAVIVTAGEVIHAEQLDGLTPEVEEEVEEAFDAGLEAAPEITGCIEDYNQGFNEGMKALRNTLRTYYAGDEDAPAYSLGLWLDEQMEGLRK